VNLAKRGTPRGVPSKTGYPTPLGLLLYVCICVCNEPLCL
jgi:hypothetical protein